MSWLLWINLEINCTLCSNMNTDGLLLFAGTHRIRAGERYSWTSLACAGPDSFFSLFLLISATSQGSMGSVVRLSRDDQPMYQSANLLSAFWLLSLLPLPSCPSISPRAPGQRLYLLYATTQCLYTAKCLNTYMHGSVLCESSWKHHSRFSH